MPLRRAVKAEHRSTAHNLSHGGTEAIRAHPRPNAGRTEVNRAAYPRAAGLKIFRIGLQNLSGDGRLVET